MSAATRPTRESSGGGWRWMVLLAPVLVLVVGLLLLLLPNDLTPEPGPTGERTVRMIGGSELEDMQPIFARALDEIGIRVVFTSRGSVEGARELSDPSVRAGYDVAMFGSDQFFPVFPESLKGVVRQSRPIMRSPVILGLHSDAQKSLGWSGAVRWEDVLTAATGGRLRYGMTRPDYSNSGLSILLGLATALAETGAPLTPDDIPRVLPDVRRFFIGNRLSAESSRWLADRYLEPLRGQSACRRNLAVTGVDGLFTYESEVLRLQVQHPEGCLNAVYPSNGTIVAEYRMTLLDRATGDARSAFDALAAWLYSDEIQQEIVRQTLRRPGNPDVNAPAVGPAVTQLRFPTNPEVVRRMIEEFRAGLRPPSRMIFVLDLSGSMAGQPLADLKFALRQLTGTDPDNPATYYSFLPGEHVVLLPFATTPGVPKPFVLPLTDTTATLSTMTTYISGMQTGASTAMYQSIEKAHEIAAGWQAEPSPPQGRRPHVSIVVLSDGQNNCGPNRAAYEAYRRQLPADGAKVPIFTIRFGIQLNTTQGSCAGYRPDSAPTVDCPKASAGIGSNTSWARDLCKVAADSGGEAYKATTGAELTNVFWKIRGYQ